MALSASPRKIVPLASGDSSRPRKDSSSSPGVTKRVFYCGVVVEGSENGRRLPDDIQDFVLSFGNPLPTRVPAEMHSSSSDPSSNDNNHAAPRKRALTDASALASVINELLTSERSYVKRLQILKHDYADPLRNFARSKDTAIIPAYEAKTLFGNVDNLLPVNEAFLTDLEKMMAPNGGRTVGGVGDVALRHFKELRGFEQYKQYYVKREDAQLIFEREVSKRSSRFASYIDHIKYQSSDSKNRVGLRELLMEPVQRIPRYTLLFRTMLKHMAPGDPQREKLIEADEIASKIALAEADEQTKRAAIFYCLTATIDGFPPDLFSNSRRFIDCIDVEDVLTDTSAASISASSSGSLAGSLHCTLFLFDDKLVIVKRPGNGEKGARVLSGLDELDKVTKAGGIPAGKKKSGMVCKGVLDVTDVVATDVGGAEINLYLENPPQDTSDRWSGRPFRSLFVVHPPAPVNLDPTHTEADKRRFLENLWHVQATYRSRAGQSVVLCADEQEVESKAGRITVARTYFNVYQRTAFLQEPKKTKIVVHIDPLGSADPIPFGIGTSPFARIRVQPLAGGLCRYGINSSDPADEPEEDIVQTERVPSRIVQTIHQFGLFEFRTGRDSRPSTPTARSRVAIFGLDAISRNLFNTRPGSSMGDFFGGSINGHKRTKSTTSRSSMYTQTTQTTSTGDSSLMKFSHRSNSTTTAATTVSNMDDDDSFLGTKSKPRKLLKRGKSPSGSASESESPRWQLNSQSRSRSPSAEPEDFCEVEDDNGTILANSKDLDSSEWNLAMQLELARRNSKNQHGKFEPPAALELPVEATIYEEEPHLARPLSRASRHSHRSTTPRLDDDSTIVMGSPPRHSRSTSQHSHERRPLGPRTPSPLPPSKSPVQLPIQLPVDEPTTDDEPPHETISTPSRPSTIPSRHQDTPTAIPRSKRQPFFPHVHGESTPKTAGALPPTTPNPIEPLSIKKKSSVRVSNGGSPMPARKTYARNSPLSRHSTRITPTRRVSPQLAKRKLAAASHDSAHQNEMTERMLENCRAATDDIESSRRTIKRIKLQVDDLRTDEMPQSNSNDDVYSRPSSPDKDSRTPQRAAPPMTKAAQERMEEMRQLIGRRQMEGVPRTRSRSTIFDTPSQSSPSANLSDASRSIETLVTAADKDLSRAVSCHETLRQDIMEVATTLKEKAAELERARVELQNTKRQCELVKSLLDDATAEKEIMYEAFNEELDGMYNDFNLPDDEAWAAMTEDLRVTKEVRNALSQENSQLKRRITEAEMQRDEWGALLRAHGLIP